MRNAQTSPDAMAVVTVDRLPAWMIPAYGCAWVAMPKLDALAGRGIVFDRVMATSDDTHDTLGALAGREPTTSAPLPLLAIAAEHGSPSAFVTDDPLLAAAIRAPTETCVVATNGASTPAVSEADTNIGKLFGAASAVVAKGLHRVIWCHASSLGFCWDAPVRFRDRYVDPDDPPLPSGTRVPNMNVSPETDPDILVAIRHAFAGQLSLLDHCLGTLLEAIEERPERWTILVAGAGGLGLGLHGTVGCAPTLPFSEVIQLPAILVDHRERMAGQRYGGLLMPDDLGVTLLDGLGCAPDPLRDPRRGRSLGGLLDRWQGPGRDRILSRSARGTAVATPSWHLVQPTPDEATASRAMLFSKPDDFFEACDVADRCPAVADELSSLAMGDVEQAWLTPLSHEALHGS